MNEEKQQNLGQTKKCPKCQEEISKNAKKCKHCGSDLRNWFVRHKIISVILILLVIGIIGGGDNKDNGQTINSVQNKSEQELNNQSLNNSINEETVSIKEKTYQEIFKFSGNGVKKSEPFIITGDRFKIKYDCKGTICQAFLKNTKSEYGLELIMNSTDPVKDETIIYGAGEYYIDANTIGSYSMIVEDYK